jgi:hypothetical protein
MKCTFYQLVSCPCINHHFRFDNLHVNPNTTVFCIGMTFHLINCRWSNVCFGSETCILAQAWASYTSIVFRVCLYVLFGVDNPNSSCPSFKILRSVVFITPMYTRTINCEHLLLHVFSYNTSGIDNSLKWSTAPPFSLQCFKVLVDIQDNSTHIPCPSRFTRLRLPGGVHGAAINWSNIHAKKKY